MPEQEQKDQETNRGLAKIDKTSEDRVINRNYL